MQIHGDKELCRRTMPDGSTKRLVAQNDTAYRIEQWENWTGGRSAKPQFYSHVADATKAYAAETLV